MGACGLPLEKLFRVTPSKTSENALSEHGIKVAITIDLCFQKETESFNLGMKEEHATLTLLLLLYAYSPTLQTKSHTSGPTERLSTPECALEFICGKVLSYHYVGDSRRFNCPADCAVVSVGGVTPPHSPELTPLAITKGLE